MLMILCLENCGEVSVSRNLRALVSHRPFVRKKYGALNTATQHMHTAETQVQNVNLGKVLGQGAYSEVHECTFQKRQAAAKVFRNTDENKAFREIEMMFSLRHPNIIGLFAWFQIKGAITQTGMVIELAKGGDLCQLYKGELFSFHVGLKALAGAADGLLYMHSRPVPIVHRDIKSSNIMIMDDGVTGKLGDCGESRRVDLNSTMTQTGTPLWAAVSQERERERGREGGREGKEENLGLYCPLFYDTHDIS